jgi:formylglycine-generating enzyme required for sulfatase activity
MPPAVWLLITVGALLILVALVVLAALVLALPTRGRGLARGCWLAFSLGLGILFGSLAAAGGGLVGLAVYLGLTPAEDLRAGGPTEVRTRDTLPAEAAPAAAPEPPEAPLPGPGRLDCRGEKGVSRSQVKAAQEAWARFLGRQAEEEDEVAPGVRMAFVLVPPGKFLMGSTRGEPGRGAWAGLDPEEEARHEVQITRPFYLGKCEVTQEQYQALAGTNPSWFSAQGGGKDAVAGMDTRQFPVETVSWDEAAGYADALTKGRGGGLVYRLPPEAEWEYACRGGRPASQPFGVGDGTSLTSDQANVDGTHPYGGAARDVFLRRTSRVGSYAPNAFGLADMHGNVWEWCADRFGPYAAGKVADPSGPEDGQRGVYRGGSWKIAPAFCRAAQRAAGKPNLRQNYLGFRLTRVPPEAVKADPPRP